MAGEESVERQTPVFEQVLVKGPSNGRQEQFLAQRLVSGTLNLSEAIRTHGVNAVYIRSSDAIIKIPIYIGDSYGLHLTGKSKGELGRVGYITGSVEIGKPFSATYPIPHTMTQVRPFEVDVDIENPKTVQITEKPVEEVLLLMSTSSRSDLQLSDTDTVSMIDSKLIEQGIS